MFHSKDFSSFSIYDISLKIKIFFQLNKKINKLLSQSMKFKKDDKNFELNYTSEPMKKKILCGIMRFIKKII